MLRSPPPRAEKHFRHSELELASSSELTISSPQLELASSNELKRSPPGDGGAADGGAESASPAAAAVVAECASPLLSAEEATYVVRLLSTTAEDEGVYSVPYRRLRPGFQWRPSTLKWVGRWAVASDKKGRARDGGGGTPSSEGARIKAEAGGEEGGSGQAAGLQPEGEQLLSEWPLGKRVEVRQLAAPRCDSPPLIAPHHPSPPLAAPHHPSSLLAAPHHPSPPPTALHRPHRPSSPLAGDAAGRRVRGLVVRGHRNGLRPAAGGGAPRYRPTLPANPLASPCTPLRSATHRHTALHPLRCATMSSSSPTTQTTRSCPSTSRARPRAGARAGPSPRRRWTWPWTTRRGCLTSSTPSRSRCCAPHRLSCRARSTRRGRRRCSRALH